MIYKPSIFRLDLPLDKIKFDSIVNSSQVIVSDTIEYQLEDYIKSINPSKKFSKDQMTKYIEKHLKGKNTLM